MARFDTEEEFSEIKSRVSQAVEELFPIESGDTRIVVSNVAVRDEGGRYQIADQKKAILNGKSWDVPIYGDVELQKDGRVVDKKRLLLAKLPKLTDRYGFIVNGKEYQSYTQLRQKSGVFHRVASNKNIVADYNLANRDRFGGQRFRMFMVPRTGIIKMEVGDKKINAYHLLKNAGATDAEIEKAMGKKLAELNRDARSERLIISQLRRATNSDAPKEELMSSLLATTRIDPEVSEATLGKAHDTVDKEVLLKSVKRMVSMSKGTDEGDDRANLQFLSTHTVEDLLANRVRGSAGRVGYQGRRAMRKKRSSRTVLAPIRSEIQKSINAFFNSSLASQDPQTNPLQMLEGHRKTTIMGDQGGVKSSYAVLEDSKLVNASHLSFLDPVHTPEGDKTGITLSLPLGVRKRGTTLFASFIDPKTGKVAELSPKDAFNKKVAFTDQYKRRGRRFTPTKEKVKATFRGELVELDPKDVDYILPSPRTVFGAATNLVPFLQNNQGNRAMTAAKQGGQALSLVYREQPKVQVASDTDSTFEEVFGQVASFRSPTNGVVERVTKDRIVIRGDRGKKEVVQIYNDFPLEGGTMMDSEPVVQKGQKVRKGDLLADTNYTKGGVLSLGTNLKTAYMPFRGYNFEDGVIISETAAKKLTSSHITKKDTSLSNRLTLGKRKFVHQFPTAFNKRQVDKLGDDGVIKVGTRVDPGDPLILVMSDPFAGGEKSRLSAIRKGKTKTFTDKSVSWSGDTPGVVTDIARSGDAITVYVRTEEPAQQGDKLVGRHGNKGIITRILPDSQMPYRLDKDGNKEALDLLLNPMGVPGRINLGQILETAAAKISNKTGQPFKVKNFDSEKNYLEDLKKDLKKHGIEDKEVLINPETGKAYKQKVMAGEQYIFKLRHQVRKKMKARAGGLDEEYDVSGMPTSGGKTGGVSLGELGMYSMLAHGARENLHEMYAYKSEMNPEFFRALRDGTPIPTPKVPFAFQKFAKYLEGMRVNLKKDGNNLALVPFTEDQVRQLAPKALPSPTKVFVGKTDKPARGGLFDPVITGGYEGTRYSRFDLAEEMPNPLFEEAIIGVTGLTKKQFQNIMSGDESVEGKVGGAAIRHLLEKVDVKRDLKEIKEDLKTARKTELNKLNKRIRYLQALDRNDLKADAYMMKSVPILPPVFRPLVFKPTGDVSNNDLNYLYRDIAKVNEEYGHTKSLGIPDEFLGGGRMALYDGLKALTGTGGSLSRKGDIKGILDIISGATRDKTGRKISGDSKRGYFQSKVMKRRQDFSARSTITPEPQMGLDEVGLPEDIAYKLYKPFVLRDLARVYGGNKIKAEKVYENREPIVEKILARVSENHPVLIKRDPALHKFNIMAFKPRIVKGKSLEIHPLTVGGFNADFDGDAMNIYLPTTPKAIRESYKMLPSNNLFNPTTGGIMYMPGHEGVLGVYLASKKGKDTSKSFKSVEEARTALDKDEIEFTDQIKIDGKKTTLGRTEIDLMLPESLRMGDKMPELGSGEIRALLTRVAKQEPSHFGEVANKLKDLGNDYSTDLGFSIGLDDFTVINQKRRDGIFAKALKDAKGKKLADRLKIFSKADDDLDKANFSDLEKNPTNIYEMMRSGSRGKPQQLKQIISSPVLVKDGKDRVVPNMITRSYSEGLDLGSYWTALHGARKGTVAKVQGVRDPGYISKQLINSAIDQIVTIPDCGTKNGIELSTDDPDIVDRFIVRDYKFAPRGAVFTPAIQAAAEKAGVKRVKVRSPMRCEADHGVCKKCAGLTKSGRAMDIGTNFGVTAAQSIGEPSTQLSLNVFHHGGIAKGRGSDSVGKFKQLSNLLRMPTNLQSVETAALAKLDGRVDGIRKAPQGGFFISLIKGKKKQDHYVSANQDINVKRGDEVRKGDAMTSGFINSRDLLPLKGMEAVQDQISEDLYGVLKTVAPVRRRNIEVVVKAATDSAVVQDSGDHPDWLRGDRRKISQIRAWNRANKDKKQIKHDPELFGIDVLPKILQEDWIARLNYQDLTRSLAEAAQKGYRSNIHAFHPVPALAFAKEFGQSDGVIGEY